MPKFLEALSQEEGEFVDEEIEEEEEEEEDLLMLPDLDYEVRGKDLVKRQFCLFSSALRIGESGVRCPNIFFLVFPACVP